jgi:hypothetical protein
VSLEHNCLDNLTISVYVLLYVLILIVILDCECVENLSVAMHLLIILFILLVIFEHTCGEFYCFFLCGLHAFHIDCDSRT